MVKLNSSSERNTFQMSKYLERRANEGKTPENNKEVFDIMNIFKSESERKKEKEQDLDWQKNNLEYDLRSTKWICDKVKANKSYAQNLYAAMCNNDFQKISEEPDKKWSCSWRYAGGIIADMREEGDYIDWYCSGIRDTIYNDKDISEYTEEQHNMLEILKNYVSESIVTSEVRVDLHQLGWIVETDTKI